MWYECNPDYYVVMFCLPAILDSSPLASWYNKESIGCTLLNLSGSNSHLCTFCLLFYEYFEFRHTTLFLHTIFDFRCSLSVPYTDCWLNGFALNLSFWDCWHSWKFVIAVTAPTSFQQDNWDKSLGYHMYGTVWHKRPLMLHSVPWLFPEILLDLYFTV